MQEAEVLRCTNQSKFKGNYSTLSSKKGILPKSIASHLGDSQYNYFSSFDGHCAVLGDQMGVSLECFRGGENFTQAPSNDNKISCAHRKRSRCQRTKMLHLEFNAL